MNITRRNAIKNTPIRKLYPPPPKKRKKNQIYKDWWKVASQLLPFDFFGGLGQLPPTLLLPFTPIMGKFKPLSPKFQILCIWVVLIEL